MPFGTSFYNAVLPLPLTLDRLEIRQLLPSEITTSGLSADVVTILEAMVRLSDDKIREGPLPYQRELLANGYFSISERLRSSTSYVINDKSVLYRLEGDDRFSIIATYLAVGSALYGLTDALDEVCYNMGDVAWGVRRDHLEKFAVLLGAGVTQSAEDDVGTKRLPCIVTGDANFAHVAWNQLPALENAFIMGSQKPTIVVTHEPLGPLDGLIPGIDSRSVERLVDFEFSKINDGPRKTFIPIGGSRIPLSLRTRLTSLFLESVSGDAANIISDVAESPVLVLTLRSHNRTATNLVDTITTICHASLERFANLHIVLDGHSYPADFRSNRSYDVPAQTAIVNDQIEMAREIRGRVTETNQPRIHVAVGFDIRDSIAIGSNAVFYFAHHGTVQHKIGWFYNCPGVVHSNPQTLALNPAPWVQNQVEDGIRPTYLPVDFVSEVERVETDDTSTLGDVLATLHHENYKFRDSIETASFVLNLLSIELVSPIRA